MKQKKWWQYLISIPIVLIIDIVIFIGSLLIDGLIFKDSTANGHGFPVASLISIFVIIVLTLAVTISSIRKAIKSTKKEEVIIEDSKKKSFIKSFLPLFIFVVVSIILVSITFNYEINSFYNDPNHIGFAIPIITFILAIIAFVINIIIFIVCIKKYKK